jgi:hypothetical protein
MDIQVQVRAGQQERLLEKLSTIQKENRHTFAGTVARYILKDSPPFTTLSIWLIWKASEMPDEVTRQRDFEAFKAELADELQWETAHISIKEGIIYT